MDQLEKQRKIIDKLDTELIKLLGRRVETATRIAKIKKELKMPRLDSKRFKKVLEDRVRQAKAYKLHPKFIKKIYHDIHEYVLKIKI